MSRLSESLRSVIIFLFHALIVTVPLTWTFTTSELFEFPKMLVVYAFTILIGSLWLARSLFQRRLIWTKTFLDLPLLLFFLSQVIATLFSLNPHTSLYGYYSRFHGGLFSTLAYLTLYYALVSHFTVKDAKKLLITLVLTGVIVSLYAFPEHYHHSVSCLFVSHEFTTNCWSENTNPKYRAFGTFGQPNWLAAYLITIFFIPLSLATSSMRQVTSFKFKRLWPVAGYLCLVALYFAVLLFTKSRSGLLGLTIGAFIFWPLVFYTLRRQLKSTLLLFSVWILLLSAGFLWFGRGALPQLDTLLQPSTVSHQPLPSGPQLEVGGTESGTIRRIVWQGALDLWRRYPLFGSGVETFAYGYYQVRPAAHNLVSEWDFLYNKAHNEFLNYLATTGLFGLFAYLATILTFTGWSFLHIFRPKSHATTLIALLSGYWALMVSNFFGFSTVPVGLLFFLFPALAYVTVANHHPPTINLRPLRPLQYLALLLLILVSGYSLLRVITLYRADRAYALGKRYADSQDLASALIPLQQAVKLFPSEPVYTDELALTSAKAALSLALVGDPTSAQPFADQAESLTDYTIARNPAHLNFWKTRARVFVALSTLDDRYAPMALAALETASTLAPTDAKIFYNLALLNSQLNHLEAAQSYYQKALKLKPNYPNAAIELASVSAALATLSATSP
ncbi:hypothetical protein A2W24_06770 [Microgenomates group bacterium RBG_16_45_19]|nr:MAG: hypothetical protein A2W24_06770 [Microgenomates group bacterium RBG_16_45_19]